MKLLVTLCFTLFLMPSFSSANGTGPEEKIIVTLPPLSGLVTMLLPEIKSQCLLSASADPHHFQPSPRQVDMLNQGHLLVRASRDDQGWPIRTNNSVVTDLWNKENHGWLQFQQVREVLPQLATALINQFPQYETEIQSRLIQAIQSTKTLEQDWDNILTKIQPQGVFMQHPSWKGLLSSKQVPVWAILESEQHGHEHGPHHLEHALETLKLHPNALLLGSKRHSNRSLEWLNKHQEKSTSIIKMDALGNCNQPWDELMKQNLKILRENL
ncbi:MAG: zinc ABC transporter substrate-binding protein [Ghiorsea sp.]